MTLLFFSRVSYLICWYQSLAHLTRGHLQVFVDAKFLSTSSYTSSATPCIQTGRTIKDYTDLHTINKENAHQFYLQYYEESAVMSFTHYISQIKQDYQIRQV